MSKLLENLSQRGDTIVEVVIAIAVIGFVLGAAYIVTNQSITGERRSEERSEALQIVQSQLETLRSWAEGSSNTISTIAAAGTPFCFYTPSGIITPTVTLSNCVFTNGSLGENIPYNVTITYAEPNTGTYNILVQAKWAQAGGGTEYVSLNYRVFGS